MKCSALALNKYIQKSPNILFIYGSEIVLKNNAKDDLFRQFKKEGFTEKKLISSEEFKDIEGIIVNNSAGSLFGSRTLIEIIHDSGKIPKYIIDICNIKNINKLENIKIIITSNIQKISNQASWVKIFDKHSLIIECNKLKSNEEKIWLKNKLNFLDSESLNFFGKKISETFTGNLIAQQNEVNFIKLIYKDENSTKKYFLNDSAEFSPYELEDSLLSFNTQKSLRIVNLIKLNEDHYAPLLVWIIGKVVNTSVSAFQSKNLKKSLSNSGVFNSKISIYMSFINNIKFDKLLLIQKNILNMDLASKGMAGLKKEQFWQMIDNVIIKLTSR